MGSGITSLLDISRRSLLNQSQSIRVVGNNIANVDTPGYSRRTPVVVSATATGSGEDAAFGSGADILNVSRSVDSYLTKEEISRISDRSYSEVKDELLSRAESLFPIGDEGRSIGGQLTAFFQSLENLEESPSDMALRAGVVEQGQRLTKTVNSVFDGLSSLQREADNRLEFLVGEANGLTTEVARLNKLIAASEIGVQQNLTLRDQRDQTIRDLGEIVSFNSIEQSDGSVNLSLSNGFGLVTGSTARNLEVSKVPSFGASPSGLDGQGLNYVVFNFGDEATPSHFDLTNVLASGKGSLGATLSLRGVYDQTDTNAYDAVGDVVEFAARVELVARDLLTRFNQAYLGPDEDGTAVGHQPSTGDLDNNQPSTYGLFTFDGVVDSDADGLPDDLGANGYVNYAQRIQFGLSDPRNIAASTDLDATAGSLSFASGDGSNIARLLALRDQTIPVSAIGNYSVTGTLETVYDTTVTRVGSLKAQASTDLTINKAREEQIKELQASVSGVSLDEEFAKLIQLQRGFQASARMVKVGDELLSEILGILS